MMIKIMPYVTDDGTIFIIIRSAELAAANESIDPYLDSMLRF